MEQQQRKPSPGFYKVIAAAFLVIAAVLIWQAIVRHEWFFWAIGILTILNSMMAALKSLTQTKTRQ
jgi:hypothetical protein